MVLRLMKNGNYRLVGDTYVRGVMHGEALKEDGVEFREVVIE
jgi:hypothetical protein